MGLAIEDRLIDHPHITTTTIRVAPSAAPAVTGAREGEEEDVRAALDRARQSVLVLTATRDALQAQLEGALRCVVVGWWGWWWGWGLT